MANIKTLYGSDKLREAYPKINENFNELNGDINVLRTRVNTIITTPIDGEAAAQELVDARDGEVTLGKRLDRDKQIVESHLADYASHKAENVSQLVVTTRDTTLAGIQTVSFTRKPKRIDVLSLVIGTKKFSVGNVSSNSQGCIFHTEAGAMFGNGNYAIVLGEAETNNISGAITINADNTVSINWTKIGTGTTGTASIRLIAHYHD